MVSISHETPIDLLYTSLQFNDYQYCLVHLLEQEPRYLYHLERCRDTGVKVLLDTSIFELGEAFDAEKYAEWIVRLRPDEYIIPDVLEDYQGTRENLKNWLDKYGHLPGKKIGVVQGKTYQELVDCYNLMLLTCDKIAISFDYSWYEEMYPHSNKHLSWCMGRVLLLDRLVQDEIIDPTVPHHLLGIGLPSEGEFYKEYDWIESVDTSNPIVHAIKGIRYKKNWGLMHKESQKLCDLINYPGSKIDSDILEYNIRKFREYFNFK